MSYDSDFPEGRIDEVDATVRDYFESSGVSTTDITIGALESADRDSYEGTVHVDQSAVRSVADIYLQVTEAMSRNLLETQNKLTQPEIMTLSLYLRQASYTKAVELMEENEEPKVEKVKGRVKTFVKTLGVPNMEYEPHEIVEQPRETLEEVRKVNDLLTATAGEREFSVLY